MPRRLPNPWVRAVVGGAAVVAHVLLRHSNLNLHDRLKKNRGSLSHSILECHGTGDMECHLG